VTKPIEDYLGDGVYATFDGYDLTLDLRGQDDTTRIVLEPQVLEALLRFHSRAARIILQAAVPPASSSASTPET
jgi:hypothetical protein